MQVQQIDEATQNPVDLEGASNVKMRMLIGPDHNARVFHMRHFEIAPGGHTPHHTHDYEHEVVVLAGTGIAVSAQGERPLKPRDIVWVPPNEKHQFRNTGSVPLEFVCLIPAPQDCTS